jgi:hypothetical protein
VPSVPSTPFTKLRRATAVLTEVTSVNACGFA